MLVCVQYTLLLLLLLFLLLLFGIWLWHHLRAAPQRIPSSCICLASVCLCVCACVFVWLRACTCMHVYECVSYSSSYLCRIGASEMA